MSGNDSWLLTLHALLRQQCDVAIGRFFPPAQEVVQLRGTHTLCTDKRWQLQADAGKKAVLINPHFSLAGPVGALPLVFTRQLGKHRTQRPTAAQDFFDIFNHRAQSLLYRALCKYRVTLDHDHGAGSHDGHAALLAALCGVAPTTMTPHAASHARTALAAHAGLFARRGRSSTALTQLLRNYFALDASVREFTGPSIAMQPSLQTRLGRQGGNNTLGSDAWLGTRAIIVDARITVVIRIHTQSDFDRVQNNNLLEQLQPMVQAYAGYTLDVDVEIHTPTRFFPPARLNAKPRPSNSAGFGFGVLGTATTCSNTCLRLDPYGQDRHGQEPRRLRPSTK